MKLYTEEQVIELRRALRDIAQWDDYLEEDWGDAGHRAIDALRCFEKVTPIELPSDEEKREFTIDFFNWLHTNQYKYNPKVKMYQKMMINETLFFTIEELMMEFNKTLGGIDEKQQGI